MIDVPRALWLLCGSAFLAACGGHGGGGGGSPPANPPANPPATPPPAAFAFTSANAVDAAGFALSGIEQTWLVAQYPAIVADIVTRTHQRDVAIRCDATATVHFRYVDNDNSSIVSVGDVVEFEFPKCGAYTIDVALTVTAITFSGGVLTALSGNATFDLTVEPPSTVVIQTSTMLAQATGLHMVGSFKLAYSGGPLGPSAVPPSARRWQVTELAATITSGGTVETLSNGTLDRSVDAAGNYSAALSGSINSERLGVTLAFSTPTSFKGKVGFFPTEGEILVTSGATKLRVTPTVDASLGNDYADAAIDATGAGYAAPLSFQWIDFMRGGLFGWFPNAPPVINALTIFPPNPTTTTDLYVSYSVTDPENNSVSTEFEWHINGVLLANQTQSYLAATSFAKGDVVTVTLNASDGRATATRTAATTILNAPPYIVDVAIAPSDPQSSDDLTFNATAFDDDGDALAVTYAWKRNDTVIAGQTTSTLPASATQAGDSITAVITASDGEALVSAEASVSVFDTPAHFTIHSAPTTTSYGAHVQFDADAVDPDEPGTALRFRLAHGPAGMTIDPVSGQVSWDATPPMFDRTMAVHWGIGLENNPATAATGTITVNDSTRSYPLMRTGIEIPLWPAGLSVGDFDASGDAEVMILSRRSLYELKSDGAGGYRQSWMYPFALELDPDSSYYWQDFASAMATGDSDGDGKHEIFVAAGRSVFKLDGVERRVVASWTLPTGSGCRDLQFANLDGGSESEVVCLNQSYPYSWTSSGLVVLGANALAVKWEFADADYGTSLDLGNVDGDAQLEIVTAGGYVFDGATFANQWLYGSGFGRDVETGDLDGDGVDEIVAVSPLRAYSATLKSPLWEVQVNTDALLVTNIDGDPAKEMILGDNQWGSVTAYEYVVATNTATVVFQIDSQEHGVTSIAAGDVDDDGDLEFVWGSGASSSGADKLVIAGRNPAIEIEWTNEDPLQLDGPFVGGSLAGTTLVPAAPLFAAARTNSGYDGTRLIRMEPTTGDLTVSAELGSNWNGQAALAVSDYDNDGVDEAFVATSETYDGYLTAYDFFGESAEWTSPKLTIQQFLTAVEHADVTGDGHDDLIAISNTGVVFVHDVFGQSLFWQSTTLGVGRAVRVADLDADGSLDIIAVTYAGVYVYERIAGPVKYAQTASVSRPDTRDAIVLDLEGDGDLEVVVLASDRVERLDPNLQPLGAFDLPWFSDTFAVEPSSSGRKNLLLAQLDDHYNPFSAIVAVDAVSGAEVWRSPSLIGGVSRNSLQFVTIGGRRQLSFGTSAGMYLTR